MLGAYESSDQVIAFNNNIISEVTNHYIKPGKALREKEQLKFQEDYKKWYLEKEIGKEFPLGTPRLKDQPQDQEEVVEEQVDEFAEFAEN
jgi:polyhydroxyalkanoate synthesis regulator protein